VHEFHVLEGGQTPRADEGPEQIVALRMPRSLLAALDAQVSKMNAQYPGVRVTRSALVRFAIHNLVKEAATEAAKVVPLVAEPPRKAVGT
jgi:hypothetical protein